MILFQETVDALLGGRFSTALLVVELGPAIVGAIAFVGPAAKGFFAL
jgi:hypothetical protein